MTDRVRALLSGEERLALSRVLVMMSDPRWSSQPATAAVLGFSQQAISAATRNRQVGPNIRDALLRCLRDVKAIEEPTMAAFMAVYGPEGVHRWTWEKVRKLEMLTAAQRSAIKWAESAKLSPAVAAHVLISPPWIAETFRTRPLSFWTEEMKVVAARSTPLEPDAETLAPWISAEAERRRSA